METSRNVVPSGFPIKPSSSQAGVRYQDPSTAMSRDAQMDRAILSHTLDRAMRYYEPAATTTNSHFVPWSPQQFYHLSEQEPVPSITDVSSMSPQFLRMKHAQESQSLIGSSMVNDVAIDALQQQQMKETRQMADQIQARHANKYAHLKHMSPEMLNRARGRPIPQSALPPYVSPNHETTSDVYGQTSYRGHSQSLGNREVKQQMEQRQRQILSEKNCRGIQCYQSPMLIMGTTLDEAYR